jgi:hypothetical protein
VAKCEIDGMEELSSVLAGLERAKRNNLEVKGKVSEARGGRGMKFVWLRS